MAEISSDGVPQLRHQSSAPSLWHRLFLLLGAVAVGSIAGFTGQHFTGSSAWFLAVPAFLVLAWFFVANPMECLPPSERPTHNGSASE
jgi:hypothetical protein